MTEGAGIDGFDRVHNRRSVRECKRDSRLSITHKLRSDHDAQFDVGES
jgi:hypothetical protein